MNKKEIFAIGMLLIGIVFFVFAIKMIGIHEILNQFSRIEPTHVLLYLAISMIIVLVLIAKWDLILRALGHNVNFFSLFMYRQMGFAVGYVVPSFYIGGETIRALFLKKHNVPMPTAVSSVVIDRAVELPMNFLLACIMFFLVIHTLKLPWFIVAILAALLIGMIVLLVLFYYKMYRKQHFFTYWFDVLRLNRIKFISGFKKGIMEMENHLIKFFNHRKKFFAISLLISLVLWILMMVEFWTALRIVGYQASPSQIYLVVVMTGLAMTLPVPASIGVMELSQIGISVMVGIPAAVAVALSLLVRTRDFMWILFGFVFYLYNGTSYVKMLLKDMGNQK
jgi:uncharacterized protein (TIRG00374 family)